MSTSESMICKGCWQHMHMPIPIRGPLSIPFKLLGIKTSQMNPNLCTVCETMFTRVKRKKQLVIPATILFADLRGYTSLSQGTETEEVMGMLHEFYDTCASAVWARDGIVNKFIGDAVLAIFNFPIMREDHVRQAVLAGIELQRRCSEKKRLMVTNADGEARPVGVGIGIHTGQASIGEVGTAYKDFTIIGPTVNMASRIQGAANPGEILVTEEVYGQVTDLCPESESRTYQLKGIANPVKAYTLRS
ncbi:MAG: adenylate/guanylate cyclase domain-containing protein [Acidobacteria bacterium]|nr:adenylate/guanylate cyclase domain-containing protein [Acidobacteriota bacterium]